jgi:hypothetical protein
MICKDFNNFEGALNCLLIQDAQEVKRVKNILETLLLMVTVNEINNMKNARLRAP